MVDERIKDSVSYMLYSHWNENGFSSESTQEFIEQVKAGLQDQALDCEIAISNDDNDYD